MFPTAFTWKKAAPADYYLWGALPGQSKPARFGRVWRRPGERGYSVKFDCGTFHLEANGLATPDSARSFLEGQIRHLLLEASFTREGF